MLQDGGIERCACISFSKSTKITASCLTTSGQRMLEPTKADTQCPKTKKPQQDGRRGEITIESNLIPTRCVTHKLEKKYYPSSSPTIVKVHSPTSGFSARKSDKEKGKPQGIWPWSWVGFDCRTSIGLGETETPLLESTSKALSAPWPGEWGEQCPHRRLNRPYLLVLEGLQWRRGSAVAHHKDRGPCSSTPGSCPLV